MTMTDQGQLQMIPLAAAAIALLIAAAHDVAVRTVPNRLSLMVACAGLSLSLLDSRVIPAVFSFAIVFAGSWACWRMRWIGGGDVKLVSACALLVPPATLPALVLGTALSGGLLALIYVAIAPFLPAGPTRRPAWLIGRVWRAERRRIRRRLSLPYACAITAGVALSFAFAGNPP